MLSHESFCLTFSCGYNPINSILNLSIFLRVILERDRNKYSPTQKNALTKWERRLSSYVNEVNSLIVMSVVLIKYKVTRLLNILKSNTFSKWTACAYVVQVVQIISNYMVVKLPKAASYVE